MVTKAENLISVVESSLSRIFDHIDKDGDFGIMSSFRAEADTYQISRKTYEKLLEDKQYPSGFIKSLLPLRGKIFIDQDAFRTSVKKQYGKPISAENLNRLYAATRDPINVKNEKRHKELKRILRREKSLGFIELRGGFEESTGFVNEKSLFIPGISEKDIVQLGIDFKQCSVIFRDSTKFVEIATGGWTGKESDCSPIGSILNRFKHKSGKENLSFNIEIIKMFFSKLLKGPQFWRLTEKAVQVLEDDETINLPANIAEKLKPITNAGNDKDINKAVAISFKTETEIAKAIKSLIGKEAFDKYGADLVRVADNKKFVFNLAESVFQLEESSQVSRTFYAYRYKSEADIPFNVIYKG